MYVNILNSKMTLLLAVNHVHCGGPADVTFLEKNESVSQMVTAGLTEVNNFGPKYTFPSQSNMSSFRRLQNEHYMIDCLVKLNPFHLHEGEETETRAMSK